MRLQDSSTRSSILFALLTELTRSDGHPGRVTLPKSLLSGIAPRDGCDIQNRFVFK